MSQPDPHLRIEDHAPPDIFVSIETESGWSSVFLSSANNEKTAYKRAAAKLRKLADEADRKAEES